MKQSATLNFGIFPGSCLLTYKWKPKDYVKNLNVDWLAPIKNELDFISSTHMMVAKRTHKGRTYFYLIINTDFKFNDYCYCKLAHEIVHLCQFHLPDLLDRDREIEAEAYLHTHLMQQALLHLRKFTK